MINRLALIAIGTLFAAAPASANHLGALDVPYATRGACEAATADIDNVDRDGLLRRFPDLFTTRGDTRAFITAAFDCEFDEEDEMWYITDHLQERLGSDWFQRRQR
jgi:hypothetical protein